MELFSWDIRGVTLIPADGGAFDVSVGGVLMYSKLKLGQFPDQKQWVLDNLPVPWLLRNSNLGSCSLCRDNGVPASMQRERVRKNEYD